ncbi:MmgE/PrpD family protein [Achromobacter marplatensis]|uniref:MmgE/PrpD family protein n=1 Tax=Achromobacter marplatensis TaxID=470868 RepID=UPI0028ECE62C|nr:MmgE/PrpD family protein [Achromobacter marplatensis]
MKTINDPIDTLLEAAQARTADTLPVSVLAFQRLRILDNLACLAAGYDGTGTGAAQILASRWSGCAEASVLGSTLRLAAGQAAFVNAVRARALDYCDVISPGWHPSSSDIPVALACAELSGATGSELLAALAIGQDFAQRINMAAQAQGFFYKGFDSNVLGLFSGSVIAARLLRLQPAEFNSAVGLAFDFGIGTFQHYQDKTLAVRIGQGLVARHAIEAAQLAAAGISGPRRVLNGENGFFNLYAPGLPDLSQLTEGLGSRFLGQEATCFKPYPHCSILLALTDALLAARTDLMRLDLAKCEMRLEVSPTMRMVCGARYEPTETAEIDAQFSACYVAANALLRGRATPLQFSAASAREYDVVELAQRIQIAEVSEWSRFDQCRLIVSSEGRAPIVVEAAYGKGWPENPLEASDLLVKFIQCCNQSGCLTFRDNAEDIASQIERLEGASSVAALLRATCPKT